MAFLPTSITNKELAKTPAGFLKMWGICLYNDLFCYGYNT